MSTVNEAKARAADPQTTVDAEARAQVVSDALDRKTIKRYVEEAMHTQNMRQRVIWMYRAADQLGLATKNVAPCKNGCAHCCYQPVLVTPSEAKIIEESGAARINWDTELGNRPNKEYVGQPCPFLKDNKCSIYQVRPFSCRVHYSLDKDSMLCEVHPGENIQAPYLDNRPLYDAYFASVGVEITRTADIRDWFVKTK